MTSTFLGGPYNAERAVRLLCATPAASLANRAAQPTARPPAAKAEGSAGPAWATPEAPRSDAAGRAPGEARGVANAAGTPRARDSSANAGAHATSKAMQRLQLNIARKGLERVLAVAGGGWPVE